MQALGINVALASAIFFGVSLAFGSSNALFATIVFAMTYAAVQVALVLFRGDNN